MTYREFWHKLLPIYDTREAQAIARWVFEKQCNLSFEDICFGKDTQICENDAAALEKILHRLLQQEPIQYVLGEQDFCGLHLYIKKGVLIPRPETADLCEQIAQDFAGNHATKNVLDLCSGSGCIALALKHKFPDWNVHGCDLSDDALEVSQTNAKNLALDVHFFKANVLELQSTDFNEKFDCIVSNPPYVCDSERADMAPNVVEYEPSMALFVPDDDPLRFYRAIIALANDLLNAGGALYFEINPRFADAICNELTSNRYTNVRRFASNGHPNRLIAALKP